MQPEYIWHLTLETGHGRKSHRREVEAAAVVAVTRQIEEALATGSTEIRPGYRLSGASAGGTLLATVESEILGPLVTIGIAPHSRTAGRLWVSMRASGLVPRTPWCAVRLYPALEADLEAAEWLGDFERCLAWAWIEGHHSA